MELRSDSTIEAQPGDFSCRVDGSDLVVPVNVAEFARSAHLHTAEELAGYAQAFPSSVAASLGWGPPAVMAAVSRLHDQLSQAGLHRAASPPERVYGWGG